MPYSPSSFTINVPQKGEFFLVENADPYHSRTCVYLLQGVRPLRTKVGVCPRNLTPLVSRWVDFPVGDAHGRGWAVKATGLDGADTAIRTTPVKTGTFPGLVMGTMGARSMQ